MVKNTLCVSKIFARIFLKGHSMDSMDKRIDKIMEQRITDHGHSGQHVMHKEFFKSTTIKGTIEIMPKPSIHAVAITQDGIVYTLPKPARHADVIAEIVKRCGKYRPYNGEQGFITSLGTFVDREQAALLAVYSGQVTKLLNDRELFSEDLW